MEVNLLSFIILIINKDNNERSLKYFIIQSLGSVLIISCSLLLENNNKVLTVIVLIAALMLKLGAAPLHFWLPAIIEKLKKFQLLTILTWQKLTPLYILATVYKQNIIFYFAFFSIILGALGSLNELRIKTIITYSSINHTGWILILIYYNELLAIIYLIVYFILLYVLITSLNSKDRQINWFYKNKNSFLIYLNLLSIAGLPPFTGFIVKWLLFSEIIKELNLGLLFILIFSSIVLLYFYLRITINRFLINQIKNNKIKITSEKINLISIINLPLFYFALL